ncbi:MAG TPA: SPOR domain-containing protein [Bacteroidetes bacterium]|nr:SPOR domain-containing protein [Bacteroidota bacterium]
MKKCILFISLFAFCIGLQAQKLVKAEELINGNSSYGAGRVEINQDVRVDSLLSRHIMTNEKIEGINGYRIQIYRGSGRNAREEANDTKAEFISEFPGIHSYLRFDPPNYFKVRIGDYRTRHDAYPDFIRVKQKFPNAYIVNDVISYPDPEK